MFRRVEALEEAVQQNTGRNPSVRHAVARATSVAAYAPIFAPETLTFKVIPVSRKPSNAAASSAANSSAYTQLQHLPTQYPR